MSQALKILHGCRCCLLNCLFTTVWQHQILHLSLRTHSPEHTGFMDMVVGPKPPGSRCGLAAGTGSNVARLQHPVLSCRQTRAPNFALPSICQQLAACEEQAGSSTSQVAPHGLAGSPAPCCQRWLLGASCTQPPPPRLGCRQVLLLRPSSKAPDEFPSFIYIVTLKVFIDRDRISSGSQHC